VLRPRAAALLAALACTLACQVETGAQPPPSPSPFPRVAATDVALQPQDIPAAVPRCAISGPMAAYLAELKVSNPDLYSRLAQAWKDWQAAGARDGAVVVYAEPAACASELGADSSSRAAASLVLVFRDDAAAERAWLDGILGLKPPPPDQRLAGLARGAATGLGDDSWTFRTTTGGRAVFIACWREGPLAILLTTRGLSARESESAAAAVFARGRLN